MVWSTPSRTSRRTSRTTIVPPSSRRWAASSSSWPPATGRSWPTPPENPRSTATGGTSRLLPLIEDIPLARRSLTVARAFFRLSAVLTDMCGEHRSTGSLDACCACAAVLLSCAALLNRRARHRAIGAVDAAVARLRFQHDVALLALVEPLTRVRRHGLRLRVATLRASEGRLQD